MRPHIAKRLGESIGLSVRKRLFLHRRLRDFTTFCAMPLQLNEILLRES